MKGPRIPIAVWADKEKYRETGETHEQKCSRVAQDLSDGQGHYERFYNILVDQVFLPGGRVQSAAGSMRQTTAFNCFVMQTVPDSMNGILEVAAEAAETMRRGGGVGYDFSNIRPKGSRIHSLDSIASGPVSFMAIYDSICSTISSAGHRRGAQMACLRVDHPDIVEFITAKANTYRLTNFNVSVLVTDAFMEAVKADTTFDLVFDGEVYETVRASLLWDTILRNTWDWAEPGVIFVDRVNEYNNLWYCEDISATNPCGEQPLPPYGACLLGSFNLTKFVKKDLTEYAYFDFELLRSVIPDVVRAMDNVIDRTTYPLKEQAEEARNKRRMGLGITGLANALTFLGIKYGTKEAQDFLSSVLAEIANQCYSASAVLALEKGPFPLFDKEKYLQSKFVQEVLADDVKEKISRYGIRNSHLTSIAPTGTISLTANNVSSGIEPVFSHSYTRTVQTPDGPTEEVIEDYAFREWGLEGTPTSEVTVQQHVDMLCVAQKYVDSAVSKTCNVGDNVSWSEFRDVYMRAYDGGAKGCTTFRAAGKRMGILNASTSEDVVEEETEADAVVVEGSACYIDPETGIRSCE